MLNLVEQTRSYTAVEMMPSLAGLKPLDSPCTHSIVSPACAPVQLRPLPLYCTLFQHHQSHVG